MKSRNTLFTLLAPLSLPAYALFLAVTNLLGAAYYIVVEASLSRFTKRPISLSRTQLIVFAVPVLLLAPVATAAHMILWIARLVLRGICALGRWQAGVHANGGAFLFGLVWALAAVWTTVTCFNAAAGLRCLGKPIGGQDAFVNHFTRDKLLGEMPADMQARRRQVIDELKHFQDAADPHWQRTIVDLEDDTVPFTWFARAYPYLAKKFAGMPWFYFPAELSRDGLAHSALLLGALFFVWIILIRWPGTFALVPTTTLRCALMLVRAGVCVWAIHALATWSPLTTSVYFPFDNETSPVWFRMFSPASWLGVDLFTWVRLEWYLFNAGVWIALVGLVAWIWWLAWRISPFVAWPRYYVAFLASRLLQRKRIAFFSVGAVTLCVAMMIIVISVMGGFVDSIRDRAHGLLGDLVMDGDMRGFPGYEEFIDLISRLKDDDVPKLDSILAELETSLVKKDDSSEVDSSQSALARFDRFQKEVRARNKSADSIVVQATPLIHSYGLFQFQSTGKTKAVGIWGVRLDEYKRVNEFGKDLFYDKRYGGTMLGPQAQPVWAFDDKGIATLPAELEQHYRDYLESLDPVDRDKEERRYRREPGYLFPGPGWYRESDADPPVPGYEGNPLPGLIPGRDLIARRLPSGEYRRFPEYRRGDLVWLTVLPLTRSGIVSPEMPPRPAFRYVDDSRTGIHDIDSRNVYVDFDELQRLLSMGGTERVDDEGNVIGRFGPRCRQIQIKLSERYAKPPELLVMKKTVSDVWHWFTRLADPAEQSAMDGVDTQTWEEMQRDFISAIEKEKFLVLIMFGVISIVAVFLILCIFYMIVQEKTRDIGIIKSVGASAEGVAAVFLVYGAAIGLVGCVLGSILGTVFVEHINEIQDWLARLNPDWRVWSPEHYSFDKIPDIVKWSDVAWISLLSIAASIAGAAFPAVRASRTWPVESLRYE